MRWKFSTAVNGGTRPPLVAVFVAAVLVTAAVLVMAAAAAEGRPRAPRPSTFVGSCHLELTVAPTPPYGATLEPVADVSRGTGVCSGRFISGSGRVYRLAGSAVRYRAADAGPLVGCPAGVQDGGGALLFRWGRVRFRLAERRVVNAAVIRYDGTAGGSAVGVVAVSPQENPVRVLQECFTSGVSQVRVIVELVAPGGIAG